MKIGIAFGVAIAAVGAVVLVIGYKKAHRPDLVIHPEAGDTIADKARKAGF